MKTTSELVTEGVALGIELGFIVVNVAVKRWLADRFWRAVEVVISL